VPKVDTGAASLKNFVSTRLKKSKLRRGPRTIPLGASVGLQDFALVGLLALTILGTATSSGHWARFLGSHPFLWLGEVSYSIYMVHFPILIVIRRLWERLGFADWHPAGKTFAFLATVALVVGLAAMLFYVVERPARTRLRDQMGRFAQA
jgi:peptidoglycan/LPS O-acetylase OafA/YrhL